MATNSTCINIQRIFTQPVSKGIWKVKNSSLFLYMKTNQFKIDSLNKTGYNGHFLKVPNEPSIYRIRKNKLIRFVNLEGSKKGIEKLKLISDSNWTAWESNI